MTDKTTQELREAIEDLFINAKVDESEDSTYYADKAMALIAKHEDELVEDVIGADEGYDESAVLLDTNTVIATKIKAQNDLRAEQRTKLTALTEKESKE